MIKIKTFFVLLTVLFMGWTTIFAQETGGYLGFGLHYGTDKTIGAQLTYGVASTSVGKPGSGPYLFPGVAVGVRRSFKHNTTYYYSDLQLTFFNGLWGGVGVGPTFSEFGTTLKGKAYGGFLFMGASYEKPVLINKQDKSTFIGGYLGMARVYPGSHFMP